jgi:hypothetical protein
MTRFIRAALAAALWGVLGTNAAALGAQSPPTVPLAPEGAVADRDFTSIVGVRELSDGSVVVADGSESYVYHVGFGSTPGRGEIGRTGDGPREYRSVTAPYPIGRDSTLFVDLRRRRWVLVTGSLTVGDLGTYRSERAFAGPYVAGGSEGGYVLAQALPPGARSISRADSLFLLRLTPFGVDTLATLDGVGAGPLRQAMPGWFVAENPLIPQDHAGMAPDGSVAVLRHNPYRVEWHREPGGVVLGPRLETGFPRLTDEAKCRAMGGIRRAQETCDPSVYDDWPDRAPAYSSFSRVAPLLVARSDLAFVRRFSPTGDGPEVYDVIDGQGERVARVRLSPSQTIVGASHDWLYTVTVDQLGLQTLTRHSIQATLSSAL